MDDYLGYLKDFYKLPKKAKDGIKPSFERSPVGPKVKMWVLKRYIDKLNVMAKNRNCDRNVILGRLLKSPTVMKGETFHDEDGGCWWTQIVEVQTFELLALVKGENSLESRANADDFINKI